MDTKELNEYIKNYLENDKTQRAIMLTAPWGSGKSYYIKHSLCPFLLENELDYAVVSLYGLKEIKEVSKSLYLEVRAKKLNGKSEKLAAGKIIGKTLLKGVASFFGVDLSQSEEDLQKLYESIDLSNKLIIFEDLERTSIDIVEFLGYVNNLVELDGVKVLLVANENEIIKYDTIINDGKTEYNLTDNSKEYLKIKEKTICDTINFLSDYYESIKSILEKFDNKYFKLMMLEKDDNGNLSLVRKIKQQMLDEKCVNYRSFLYACQKTEDMLNLLDDTKEYNIEFIQNLFIGTIIYSIRLNNGNKEVWKDMSFTSTQLGNYAYPLYKIMYDYINIHCFRIEEFEYMQSLFIKTKDICKCDEILQVIYYYYVMPEKEIKKALTEICERLKKDKGIVHNEYVRIANYLIAMKSTLNYDIINECLKYMLTNTKKAVENGEDVQVYSTSGIKLLSQIEIDGFNKFKSDMLNIVGNKKEALKNFDYKSTSIPDYYEYIIKQKKTFINEKGFANKLDVDKTAKMLKEASAKEIEDFRGILQYIYMDISNIAEFMSNDIENLNKLKLEIEKIIDKTDCIDAIQRLQLTWLNSNLEAIINKLKGGKNAKTE